MNLSVDFFLQIFLNLAWEKNLPATIVAFPWDSDSTDSRCQASLNSFASQISMKKKTRPVDERVHFYLHFERFFNFACAQLVFYIPYFAALHLV